jgi:alpha-tubulin suppressor-like RCC1 family protein
MGMTRTMPTKHALVWSLGAALLATLGGAAGCGPQPPPTAPDNKEKTAPVATATSTAVACTEGKGECDGDAKTACETDLMTSAAHCGACGTACGAGQSCVAGSCRTGRSISAVAANACVVTSGRVACWGDNTFGALAAGPKGPRATPVAIQGIEDATAVRVGRRFGCAVTSAGKIACFREGNVRELSLISDVADIAIQDDTVLVLHKNGQVAGVDLGMNGKDLRPVEVPKLSEVAQLAAGEYHACVVHKNGDVTCWGDPAYNGSGKDVSNLDYQLREEMSKKPVRVKELKDVAQISVSDSHTCAVKKSKQVVCWGSNWSGELGDGTSEHRYAPVAVQLIDDAVEVVAGHHHTCARRTSGKVVCWGEGHSGQLGAGSAGVKGMVEVKDVSDAVALAAGEEFSCAARAAGGVSCWGSASRGRLGNGAISDYPSPQPVKGIAGVSQLALGERVSCAVDGSKQLQCWGVPGYSEEELEKRGYNPTPVPGLGEVESASVKDGGICAINKAKTVFCDYSQSFLKGPKSIDLGTVKAVRSSGTSGVAVQPSGQVFIWSKNWSKPDEIQKLNLTGLSDAVMATSEGSVVCAVRKSGKVGCVAYSYRSFDKKDPIKPTGVVEVPDIKDAVQIVADAGEFCVLRKSGEVGCFSSYRVPPPVDPKAPKDEKKDKEKPQPIEVRPIKGLAEATFLAEGGGTRCAIKKDATLACWGSSTYGQLGTGEYVYSWEPVQVPGLTDVATVAVGAGQVCAAKKSGDLLCWGLNTVDQAGQAAPAYARAPVPVLLP